VGRPLIWGETDCASLARASLRICFGEEVLGELPVWHTKRGALRTLKLHDPSAVLEKLGAERRGMGFARGGDIVVLPPDPSGGVSLGVWVDGGCLMVSEEDGVRMIRAPDVSSEGVVYSLWEIARG